MINLYSTAKEVLTNLENYFKTYNKISVANIKLQDPKFIMGAINKNEIFEEFYTRFILTIALLDYSEAVKINDLIRYIMTRLQYRLTKLKFKIFRELIEFLRGLDIDLRIIDKKIVSKKKKEEEPSDKSIKSSIENQRLSTSRNNISFSALKEYSYSKIIIERIKKERRYFKYLKTEYRSSDKNISYKNSKRLLKE